MHFFPFICFGWLLLYNILTLLQNKCLSQEVHLTSTNGRALSVSFHFEIIALLCFSSCRKMWSPKYLWFWLSILPLQRCVCEDKIDNSFCWLNRSILSQQDCNSGVQYLLFLENNNETAMYCMSQQVTNINKVVKNYVQIT